MNAIEVWHEEQVILGMDKIDPLILKELPSFPKELRDLITCGNYDLESARVLATTSDAFTGVHSIFKAISKRYFDLDPSDLLNVFIEDDRPAAFALISNVLDQAGGSLVQFWVRQQCLAHVRGLKTHVTECQKAIFTVGPLANYHEVMRTSGWQLRLLALNSEKLAKVLPFSIKKPNYPKIGTVFNNP